MRELKVLIGCEQSGTVRDAFLRNGHDAWSCDIEPDMKGSNRHIQDDVRNVMNTGEWDLLMVAHPPCTRLCNSGVRWLHKPPEQIYTDNHTQKEVDLYATLSEKDKKAFMWHKLQEGADLFAACLNAKPRMRAIENPIMHKHAKERIEGFFERTQKIQPYEYGHLEQKETHLWLVNLPELKETNNVYDEMMKLPKAQRQKVHNSSNNGKRGVERSMFFDGVAQAMADQWGGLLQDCSDMYGARPTQMELF